jgi:poly-gamma-glutamate synthesis protein (capsule biosynthesis protein)
LKHVPAYPFDRFGLDDRATPADFFDHRTGNGTKGHPASPEFWQSVAALCRFDKGELKQIELYPVDMGFGQPRAQRGRPKHADSELGKAILERIARVSAAFGTIVRQQAGHAVISIEQSFRSEPCQISN